MEAGLFGAGLVAVETPVLVARYNQCLNELGIAPTQLARFQVDGLGWSPEIAIEKGNNFYLSHGVSNRLAIIISPDQRNKPIYFPFTSFDRQLLVGYFSAFISEIADITITHGICLDIDNEMSKYVSPLDLLLVDKVIVRSMADDLIESAKEQRQLIERLQQKQGWFDPQLRTQIIESSKEHGDMRSRRVEIADWEFADFGSFYTRAFGGVFVFCEFESEAPLVVIEDSRELKRLKNKRHVIGIGEKSLLSRLYDTGLVESDLSWYQEHPEILDEKRECLIAELICTCRPELNYLDLTPAQKKGLIQEHGDKMPRVFHDLERLILQLDRDQVPEYKKLSRDLRLILLHPNQQLSECLQEVVGMLIARLQPLSLLCTFTYDKELFYRRYSAWPEAKKLWAIDTIKKNHHPKMHALAEACPSAL